MKAWRYSKKNGCLNLVVPKEKQLKSYTVPIAVVAVQSLSQVGLCDLMACSTQCPPVLHHLPEFAQVHVSDAVQLHSPQFISNLSRFFVLTIVSVQRKVRKWGHETHCRFDPWVRKMPWRRKWQPTPVFLPGKFHRQKSLVGYSTGLQRVGHDWATEHKLMYNFEKNDTYNSPLKFIVTCII